MKGHYWETDVHPTPDNPNPVSKLDILWLGQLQQKVDECQDEKICSTVYFL